MIPEMKNMERLTYSQAMETVLSYTKMLNTEEIPISKSLGYVTAEEITSDFDLPLTDTSGPDGYAVRSEDIRGARQTNPITLNIIDSVRAGSMPKSEVKSGTAIRIMTGAVMPQGADCVVRFEDTDEPGNKNGPNPACPKTVKIFMPAIPGDNMRKAGHKAHNGSVILSKGTTIGPAQIAAISAAGKLHVKVVRKPVVAVITTGDELIKTGKPLLPAEAYDCNTPALTALITHYGGIPRILGIARDKEVSIKAKIQKGLGADAIITSGGVSRGDYDLVRLVLEKLGKVVFSRIKMGPGASFAFGLVSKPSSDGESRYIPVFALSGPPNGCVINFETLVRPALLKMQGFSSWDHPVVEAVAEDAAYGKKPMDFVKWTDLRKTEKGYRVKLNNSEALLTSMATANSLTIIPEGSEIKAGDKIQVWPLV